LVAATMSEGNKNNTDGDNTEDVESFNRDGLTSQEVEERRKKWGFNETKQKRELFIIRLINKFMGLTPWVLEVTAAIAIVLGNYAAAVIVVLLLAANAVISFVQEKRASNAVETLKKKLAVMARVKRDGKWNEVPARELVPGDVVRIRKGDLVAADLKTFEGLVRVDQSALTGESDTIEKPSGSEVFSGSIITYGEASAFVTKTGPRTFFGKTVQLVSTSAPKLHVERIIDKITWVILIMVIVMVVVAFIVSAIIGIDLLLILPLMLVLLSSGVPVALSAMFSVTMALGSQILVKKGALITRLSASEDAASMTILCSDKTGTITLNKLSVADLAEAPPYSKKDVILYATLCSKRENNDAIDLAVLNEVDKYDLSSTVASYNVTHFEPFDPAIRRTEVVFVDKQQQIIRKAMKGQLNVLLEFCDEKTTKKNEKWKKISDGFASRGFRTIAVIVSDPIPKEWILEKKPTEDANANEKDKTHNENEQKENNKEPIQGEKPKVKESFVTPDAKLTYHLVGLIGLADQPRPDSKAIIQELKNMGIEVKMLTGDALPVAREIAKEVGLGPNIVTLADYHKKKEEVLKKRAAERAQSGNKKHTSKDDEDIDIDIDIPVHEVDGFAEIYPEDKHAIVKLLQKQGYIVGMTGDGVNDAPALSQAEVGIAVSNAADVAKGSASAVLTKEGLSAVLDLVKVGRQIHQRIVTWILNRVVKTMQQVVFIVVMFLLYRIFIIDATKMLLLLLLTDFVTVSLATDRSRWSPYPEEWRVLKLATIGALIGFVVVAESLALELIALHGLGWINDIESLRTLTFEVLFFFGMGTVFSVRERHQFWASRPSGALLISTLVDAVFIIIICSTGVPFLGIKAIPIWITAVVVAWAFVFILVLNDNIKILLFKLLIEAYAKKVT
jgi:H+-transporting ATPase